MPYTITNELKQRAKSIGVEVKSSTDPSKKLDVYQNGKLIARIGQADAMDYLLYKASKGKAYADNRRKLYYIRHPYNAKQISGVYTADYLAKALLW